MRKHFTKTEFLKSNTVPNGYFMSTLEIKKVELWIDILNPIRDMLDFPITITDGLRLGEGTSQHFFKTDGACDLRPSDRSNSGEFLQIGLMLAAHPDIMRVCYYRPSKRFPSGGFHCDRKGMEKKLFINDSDVIDWKKVPASAFVSVVNAHDVDVRAMAKF
jgi:hypothetical protein